MRARVRWAVARFAIAGGVAIAVAGSLALTLVTILHVEKDPGGLDLAGTEALRAQVLDRAARPLTLTFGNRWNLHDRIELHEVPELLRRAFVESEDRRFFEHQGVDWRARGHAVWQNVRARRAVRGASTITEQVVRMLHPRSRTVWSRWLEGFEARRLERRFGKGEILEFYLNQLPYARQRRGIVQAARDYFDRDLETLDTAEQLALVVLVRSPSRFDLRRSQEPALARVRRLAERLHGLDLIDDASLETVARHPFELAEESLEVRAPHFVRFVRSRPGLEAAVRVLTTLDGALQTRAQAALEHQIAHLADRQVGDGAALVIDHSTDEVLAWVNAGRFDSETSGSQIDAVLARRQPGSTLKPFVYAQAIEQGWTAATVIDDSPFRRAVGRGQHAFRNYSGRFYGPLRLRETLGNSLNIPAVRAAAAVTPEAFLERLKALGFASLSRHPDVYGEGLALGNGEVTLLELVSAYAALARGGVYRPARVLAEAGPRSAERRVFDAEVSSLVADILADPEARRLEFSANGVLTFPAPTAVKTGTSNDYRDAWAVGFSDRYTAGVWMGNLDLREMSGVSGSIGPAVVLRAIFAELGRGAESRPLFLSPRLGRSPICSVSGQRPVEGCPATTEWFRPGRAPGVTCSVHGFEPEPAPGSARRSRTVWLAQPTPGLHLARDPRIPDDLEAFPFEIGGARTIDRIEWLVNEVRVGATGTNDRLFLWPLRSGRHEARARVWLEAAAEPVVTDAVAFYVK